MPGCLRYAGDVLLNNFLLWHSSCMAWTMANVALFSALMMTLVGFNKSCILHHDKAPSSPIDNIWATMVIWGFLSSWTRVTLTIHHLSVCWCHFQQISPLHILAIDQLAPQQTSPNSTVWMTLILVSDVLSCTVVKCVQGFVEDKILWYYSDRHISYNTRANQSWESGASQMCSTVCKLLQTYTAQKK